MEKDITQRSFQFAVRVVKLCKHLDSASGDSRTLGNQLLRAGTSIGANVEESKLQQLCDEANQLVSILTTIIKNARENSELGMKDKERKTENA